MKFLCPRTAATTIALALLQLPAHAGCKLAAIAELPVTMHGFRAAVTAKINGADARLIVDSGASYSVLGPASVNAYKLSLHPPPPHLEWRGLGGTVEIAAANIDRFSFGDTVIPDIEFLVGGTEQSGGVAGVLGQNVLGAADVEYDIAHGMIRLMRPGEGCEKTVLAYWARNQPYSAIDMDWTSGRRQHTKGVVTINGERMHVLFDTGATSMLSLRAAERAGIKPDAAGVVPAGHAYGFGGTALETWIAPVASFKIGDEEIKNTHVRIAEMDLGKGELADIDMLIGIDFFLSHHIYVANSRSRLYFTYNGGPVFDLGVASSQPPAPVEGPEAAEPVDAAGFDRRGSAYAARRDYDHALADFSRACELDPGNADYLYHRGTAHWSAGQGVLAMADLDNSLQRRPDGLDALMARAELRAAQHANEAAQADLVHAGRISAPDSNYRLTIAALYARMDLFRQAIDQFDAWIATHEQDGRMADVLHGRCRARAQWGQELDKARADCDSAIHRGPPTASYFLDRALVSLRQGRFDESIADCDAALKLDENDAWARYVRGLGLLRTGKTEQANTDIAAATDRKPSIVARARELGIVP